MKYLFRYWDKIKRDIGQKKILLFLDYDGTLTSIVRNPSQAVISRRTKELLYKLSLSPKCKLAIISGRALKDIRSKVGIKDVIYSGNHGLELVGPQIKFTSPVPMGFRELLNRLKSNLSVRLASFKGIIIEDKGLALSIHYRKVTKRHVPAVKTILRETLILPSVKGHINVKSGKMVVEIRPPIKWDKGKVALWLLARQGFRSDNKEKIFPIYIGDDITDEDAFKALKDKGLTVFVGSATHHSAANYYLPTTTEVSRLLEMILGLIKEAKICQKN